MNEMVVIVRRDFDPLAQRLGLRGPVVALRNTAFTLGYFGATVGMEVLVEFDYFFVHVMPFRMQGEGKLPNGFVGATQQVQQMYLQEALDKLRIGYLSEAEKLKSLGGKYQNCEAMTSVLVSMVEKSWGAIVDNVDDLFPLATV